MALEIVDQVEQFDPSAVISGIRKNKGVLASISAPVNTSVVGSSYLDISVADEASAFAYGDADFGAKGTSKTVETLKHSPNVTMYLKVPVKRRIIQLCANSIEGGVSFNQLLTELQNYYSGSVYDEDLILALNNTTFGRQFFNDFKNLFAYKAHRWLDFAAIHGLDARSKTALPQTVQFLDGNANEILTGADGVATKSTVDEATGATGVATDFIGMTSAFDAQLKNESAKFPVYDGTAVQTIDTGIRINPNGIDSILTLPEGNKIITDTVAEKDDLAVLGNSASFHWGVGDITNFSAIFDSQTAITNDVLFLFEVDTKWRFDDYTDFSVIKSGASPVAQKGSK